MTHPAPVLWQWNNAHHEQARTTALGHQLKVLDKHIKDASDKQAGLEQTIAIGQAAQIELGRLLPALKQLHTDRTEVAAQHDEASTNAKVGMSMVTSWCKDNQREVPAKPDDVPLSETRGFPAQQNGDPTQLQDLSASRPTDPEIR
jgi:hypothetical protein